MKSFSLILLTIAFFVRHANAQSEKNELIQKIIDVNMLGDEFEGLIIELPPDIPKEDILPSAHDNYLYFQRLKYLLKKDDFERFEICDTDILRMFIWVDYLKNDSINKDFLTAFKREFKRQKQLLRVQGCEGVELYTYDILVDEMLGRKHQSNYADYYEKILDSIWVYSLQKHKQLGYNFCVNLCNEMHYSTSLTDDIAFQVIEYNNILALKYLLKNDKKNFNKLYRFYLSDIFPSHQYSYYELDQLYSLAEKLNDNNLKYLLRYKFLNLGWDFDKFEKHFQMIK